MLLSMLLSYTRVCVFLVLCMLGTVDAFLTGYLNTVDTLSREPLSRTHGVCRARAQDFVGMRARETGSEDEKKGLDRRSLLAASLIAVPVLKLIACLHFSFHLF